MSWSGTSKKLGPGRPFRGGSAGPFSYHSEKLMGRTISSFPRRWSCRREPKARGETFGSSRKLNDPARSISRGPGRYRVKLSYRWTTGRSRRGIEPLFADPLMRPSARSLAPPGGEALMVASIAAWIRTKPARNGPRSSAKQTLVRVPRILDDHWSGHGIRRGPRQDPPGPSRPGGREPRRRQGGAPAQATTDGPTGQVYTAGP
jgi:hypothetical protein